VSSAWLDMGDPDDPDRPLVMLVRYAPNITLAPHSHATDYSSVVVQGEVTVSGRRHTVGSMRIVAAGTTYGPLVAGPEGTTIIDTFASRNGLFPLYAKIDDTNRARLDALKEYLEARLAALQPRPRLTPRAPKHDDATA
jgi:hypothetical protein